MVVTAVATGVSTGVANIPFCIGAKIIADWETVVYIENVERSGLCLTRNQCLRFCNVFFSESAHRDKRNDEERNDEERKNALGNFLHTIYLR